MIEQEKQSYWLCLVLVLLWQGVSALELVPKFMLPSPLEVGQALLRDYELILYHSKYTLTEAFLGLTIAIILGWGLAIAMDTCPPLRRSVYPLLILSQTIPTVAIAPLLVLWFGYGILPKVILIVLVCFFPITIGLLKGFHTLDKDLLSLMKSMGASKGQVFFHVKFPASLSHFFPALRIAVSYAIVGAVISEWLGGTAGLGVYMMRVKKSYHFDSMFAVIFLISALSLVLMKLVSTLEYISMPWTHKSKQKGDPL